ncbi:MAG: hypothetical protein ACRDZR_08400 [Acidimicrobiales bacterium]
MTITVTRTAAGTAAGYEITWVAFAWCTATFTPPNAPAPISNKPTTSSFPTEWHITGVHCTTKRHPLSADVLPQSLIAPVLNSTGDYPTVTGRLPAETSEGTPLYTFEVTTAKTPTKMPPILICDASHSCRFTVAVFSKHGSTYEPPIFLSVPVTFVTTGTSTACGSAAPGVVSSVSPDRLGRAVTDLTIAACSAGVAGGAAATDNLASGQGDGSALEAFANGSADLAYSAVGYGTSGAFTPSVDRPYVAVPVAINAVVLGHVETYTEASPSGGLVLGDFPQPLRITDSQEAQLLGGGPTGLALRWSSPLGQALVGEDPELRPDLGTGTYYAPTRSITQGAGTYKSFHLGIVATSLTDATTEFATTFFHTVVPHAMVSARTGTTGRTSVELGATADFGTSTPPYNVYPSTGTDLISRALTPGAGLGFALVDATTAATMWGGLADFAMQAPASIGSGSPVYVAPSQASMDAATTEMIPQADGTLLPNPDATPVGGVQPYPLTFVEYAIAPAQPLLTPTCTPRTASQDDLKAWLNYVTGPGQAKLPAGMVPLTPALQAQAQAAVTEVGAEKTTGSCAEVKGTAGSTATSGGTAGTSKGRGGTAAAPASTSGAGATGGGLVANDTGAGGVGGNGGASGGSGPAATSPGPSHGSGSPHGHGLSASLAGFNRVEEPGWLLPALGILVLVLLLPGLALLMSGRPLRPEVEGEGGLPGSPDEPADGDPGNGRGGE